VRETDDDKDRDRGNAEGRIEERLHEAIDTLRADIARVELWAYALLGFSRPVPGYDADEKFRLGRRPDPHPKMADSGALRDPLPAARQPLKFN
jgi:hypothetical protein